MNQSTHAWLAVEAYRKIQLMSMTEAGKDLVGLVELLGENLQDVVVAAWLPDSLIKDMTYGHIFKNSLYKEEDQKGRFILSKKDLKKNLASGNHIPKAAFDLVPDSWWEQPYRVKDKGGHLPARVSTLSQTARDMFKMGDDKVISITGVASKKGAKSIEKRFLFSPRDITMFLWMASHYIADAHMPFHCDNRALASTAKQSTHCDVENIWGKQVPKLFHSGTILKKDKETILAAKLPESSKFSCIDFGANLSAMKYKKDPWKESVYICRASFATSFALVPPDVAPVDDAQTRVSLDDIRNNDGFCGEERFWDISRAIMADAVNAIARFWRYAWQDALD